MSDDGARALATLLAADGEVGVEFTATGVTITDPNLRFERYEELLRTAGALKRLLSFVIGDLINYGEAAYGQRYAQAVDATGLSPETLMNYASVCRRVARSRRRAHYAHCSAFESDDPKDCDCSGIAFTIHQEVAALEPAEQTEWLDAVVKNGWTRSELRTRLKAARAQGQLPTPEPEPQLAWTPPGGAEMPLTEETIAGAAERAQQTLERPLPDGHPLWETTAQSHAREVLTLAPAAREALPNANATRLLQATALGLLQAAARQLLEAADAVGVEEGFARVPRGLLDELASLVADE